MTKEPQQEKELQRQLWLLKEPQKEASIQPRLEVPNLQQIHGSIKEPGLTALLKLSRVE